MLTKCEGLLAYPMVFQVSELRKESDRLEEEYEGISVDKERDALTENWDSVTDLANKRRKKLEQSYDLQVPLPIFVQSSCIGNEIIFHFLHPEILVGMPEFALMVRRHARSDTLG